MLALSGGEVAGPSRNTSPEKLLAAILRHVGPAPALAGLVDVVCAPRPAQHCGAVDLDRICDAITRAADALLYPFYKLAGSERYLNEIRVRARATGLSARAILAERGEAALAPAGFACGYLRRVGQIALCAHFPKAYARLMGQSASTPGGVLAAERNALGLDHVIAGNRIAATWGLSARFRGIAWGAHDATGTVNDPDAHTLSYVLELADALVRRAGIGIPDYTPLRAFTPEETELGNRIAPSLHGTPGEVPQRIADEEHGDASRNATVADVSAVRFTATDPRSLAEQFLDQADTSDTFAVCVAIARVAQIAFNASTAIAFAAGADQDWPACVAGVHERRITLAECDTLRAMLADCSADRTASSPCLHEVPHAVLRTNVELAEALAHETNTCQLLPIARQGEMIGGVLFADNASANRATHQDVQLLVAAFGAALSAARRAQDQQRTIDTLAASNQATTDTASDPSQRLQLLAAMAAGAAHELNNPLAVITGRAQMLRNASHDESTRKALGVISEHAHRASEIVSELLAYAKPAAPQPASVTLVRCLDRLRQRWQRDAVKSATQIDVRISDHAFAVFVDPEQLDTVMDAVMSNALIACSQRDGRVIINSFSQPSDDTLVVSIGDNGCGMSPEVLAHAFDPFFSHRPAGRGRGLGLSRAARLVEINGGRMWIDSTEDSGTTVHLALPARAPEDRGR
ncbi:MAG: HDOD domain-containing protein [Phycisphaerales bacterium]|nr:HDOD domain-containing protein [Phycisphaerales bacterium]